MATRTIKIPLTNGGYARISPRDEARVRAYSFYAYRDGQNTYARAVLPREGGSSGTLLMHRLIMGEPSGIVDHIDGDGLNNTRDNLRVVTNRENQRARHHVRNKTGFKGVYEAADGRFQARINFGDGVDRSLGYYRDPAVAAIAYDFAAMAAFREHAVTNYDRAQLAKVEAAIDSAFADALRAEIVRAAASGRAVARTHANR